MSTLTPYFGNSSGTSRNGLDRLFEDVLGDFALYAPTRTRTRVSRKGPATNVSETEAGYEISVVAPGLKKTDFNVTLEDSLLSVSYENKPEDAHVLSQSAFKHSWEAPQGVAQEDVTAKYDAGILKVVVSKPDSQQVEAATIKVS